jgi:hypothetical protein
MKSLSSGSLTQVGFGFQASAHFGMRQPLRQSAMEPSDGNEPGGVSAAWSRSGQAAVPVHTGPRTRKQYDRLGEPVEGFEAFEPLEPALAEVQSSGSTAAARTDAPALHLQPRWWWGGFSD